MVDSPTTSLSSASNKARTDTVSKTTSASSPRKRAVRIVTDSSSRVSPEWAAAHQVTVLPQYITLGNVTYREDVDLHERDLAARALQVGTPFTVASPTLDDFLAEYRSLADSRVDVISLHISSAMSPTFRNAVAARDDVSGRCDVHLFDTRTMCAGLHQLVKSAVHMAESGMGTEAIVKRLRGETQHIYGIFVSDDMPYLQHSKRLRPAQAFLGNMLQIIPCLSIEEGELVAVEKVRSPERAIEKLAEFAAEFESDAHFAILQLSPEPNARTQELVETLKPALPKAGQIPIQCCGANIGAIIGNRGLGVMIVDNGAE